MDVLIEDVLLSAGAGAVFGIVGYFKNRKQESYFDGFDVKSFATTVACSAIIGAGAKYSGVTPDAFSASAVGVVVTQFIRKLIGSFKTKKK